MPTLYDQSDFDDVTPRLAISLELQTLETFSGNRTEGWIHYQISLLRGQSVITGAAGTIHANDIKGLMALLQGSATDEDFEPLEPDFIMRVAPDESDSSTRIIECLVNYGRANNQHYGASAIGIRITTSLHDAQNFATELKEQCTALTHGLEFTDYESVELPT